MQEASLVVPQQVYEYVHSNKTTKADEPLVVSTTLTRRVVGELTVNAVLKRSDYEVIKGYFSRFEIRVVNPD